MTTTKTKKKPAFRLPPWVPHITETQIVNLIFVLTPWLTPIITAWIVYNACKSELLWSTEQSFFAACIIEFNGISSTNLLVFLYREKVDKRLMTIGALVLGMYITTVLFLTIVLDTAPAIARGAPILFVLLVLSSYVTVALRGYVKAQRVTKPRHPVAQPVTTAKERLRVLLMTPENRHLSPTELAKLVQCSRANLDKIAHKNGQGWEVKVK